MVIDVKYNILWLVDMDVSFNSVKCCEFGGPVDDGRSSTMLPSRRITNTYRWNAL